MFSLFNTRAAGGLALTAFLLTGCGETIDARQLKTENGLYYKLHDTAPFTGKVKNFEHIPGFVRGNCTVEIKDGELHGAMACTARDKPYYEAQWNAGKLDGSEKLWSPETGTLVHTAGWKNGRLHGTRDQYNPGVNKLIQRVDYVDGSKEGQEKIWDVSGQHLLTDLVWKAGKQTGVHRWNDTERHFKDGVVDGVERQYGLIEGKVDAAAIMAASQTISQLRAGTYIYSSFPGTYVAQERVYQGGVLVSKTDFPKPGEAEASPPATADTADTAGTAADNGVEACIDAKMAAFRAEAGEDAWIKNDVLEEWESECRAAS